MRTCVDRLAMGGQNDSQEDANSTQVAKKKKKKQEKPFQHSLALAAVLKMLFNIRSYYFCNLKRNR